MTKNHDTDFLRTETFTDCCGAVRHFSVQLLTTDGGFFLRATEIGVDSIDYSFAAHSESSPYLALGRLRDRIREGLATKYISVEDARRGLSHRRAVGTIGYGCVVIDGQEIPFEEFAEILQTYEGWQFSLRIGDGYEEL
jgi:hypothetical protein